MATIKKLPTVTSHRDIDFGQMLYWLRKTDGENRHIEIKQVIVNSINKDSIFSYNGTYDFKDLYLELTDVVRAAEEYLSKSKSAMQ